ncbi:hypothetical protein NKE72_00505 [Streptococcus suis]|uniref:Nmad4 family putative nucleotide modification protein n=1 Tax=Streptococcus suis TaxID=1307 RepID=UPI00192D9CE3|nr:hypothetical protein [Streptococcus suis]MBL6440995.1 hypothetical protein [Streptococcus suis]MCO8238487.1 hypothetical protein [Streptococcus suis]HEM3563663.1 hypothetical protein [Streptococcus suis]HEM3564022.1 hypothetical protein [Streptococcus suis]HEM5210131.1 hypothetical protein [Streptococcus suis]
MTTTLEKLYEIYPATASIIPYKDWVIVASTGYKGTEVEIYETADSLEEFENFDRIYQVAGRFEDFGHAVKWAFEKIGE